MTESASEDEQVPKITIKFKTTQATHEIQIAENATVEKAKKTLSKKLNHPIERITLIFSGKILKDPDTVTSYGINDGMVVHMVLRATSAQANVPTPSLTTNLTSSTSPVGASLPSRGNLQSAPGVSGAQQLMGNPEFMREMMGSPIMQSMLSNPDLIRSLFADNPAIQQIIQRNPELGHMLNDPDVIRQTMEMIRNPTMFQEMMRNHDQAIRNLQGIPGGEAALQRLYQDVQEPLLSSTVGSLSGNPFASNANATDNATSRSQRAGVENAEALPNPWGSVGGAPRTAADSIAAGGTASDLTGMLQNSGMGSMFSPEMVSNLMQSMGNRPDALRSLLGGAANNPQMSNVFARFGEIASNPANMRALTNPRVLQAFQQIQQAAQVIRTEVPELFQAMFGGGMAANLAPTPPPNAPSTTSNSGAVNPAGPPPSFDLASLFGQLQQMNMGGANAANIPAQPAEERFRAQLETLVTMGFTDTDANVRALTATFGDVSAAIERLLADNGGQ